MAEKIFVLEGVYYSYSGRFPALCGVDLEVLAGQKVVLAGANGSGKSTLLQILDGLIFPDKGSIKIFGRELNERCFNNLDFVRHFRRRIGFVFQNAEVQLFCPTVREEIMFGPLQFGIAEDEIKIRMDYLVEFLGIGMLLERAPHQLSAGEKRKVALVSVLMMEPEVLLLDEPTAGLDPLTIRHIVDITLDYSEKGKTVITATHDLHIVEEIADTVCVLTQSKKIAACLSPQEFLSDTKLLIENNLIHIHRHKHRDTLHTHSHQHIHHH